MKVTVVASTRSKVPSVYIGKTFDLEFVRRSPRSERQSFDVDYYRAVVRGRVYTFSKWHWGDDVPADRPRWFVQREGCFAGTWLPEVIEG
jgi:hypothetical protein